MEMSLDINGMNVNDVMNEYKCEMEIVLRMSMNVNWK